MNEYDKLFLQLLKDSVRNECIQIDRKTLKENLVPVFRLASSHNILPLITDTVYKDYPDLLTAGIIQKAKKTAMFQAQRSADFALLYDRMISSGLKPLVLKGIICRQLYPQPELRPSADEDLLIHPEEIDSYHFFMLKNGYHLVDQEVDIHKADEISYDNPETHLYLEIHKYLFPPYDKAYGELNRLFDVLEEPASINIYGSDYYTLGYTDHLLYMICHAYKHVIYSGIGIRQICDIGLFAEKYCEQINWEKLVTSCAEYYLELFLSAVLSICEKYLGIDTDQKVYRMYLTENQPDEVPLLEDILSGGTYGATDKDRLHSSTMTLTAVSADHTGDQKSGIRRALFPSLSYMSHSYPYLKKHRYLLPLAWSQRIVHYLTDSRVKNDPGKSLAIGRKRIELLKQYGILKNK